MFSHRRITSEDFHVASCVRPPSRTQQLPALLPEKRVLHCRYFVVLEQRLHPGHDIIDV
jgi:hypothetical protein